MVEIEVPVREDAAGILGMQSDIDKIKLVLIPHVGHFCVTAAAAQMNHKK